MKIYILIILFFALTAAGFFKAASLKRKVFEIQGLINLVLNVRDKLGYYKSPVNNLISEACRLNGKYRVINALEKQLQKESKISSAWQTVDCEHILGEEACIIADEFFCNLGTSGVEGQTALCNSTVNRLESCMKISAEEWENKGKLYKSLGFLAGAFTVIIFI